MNIIDLDNKHMNNRFGTITFFQVIASQSNQVLGIRHSDTDYKKGVHALKMAQ